MEKPHCPRKASYKMELEAGKKYAWCTCGKSAKQPFCDGSHKGSCFTPVVFTAEKSGLASLCGCKATRTPPFCDGSHREL